MILRFICRPIDMPQNYAKSQQTKNSKTITQSTHRHIHIYAYQYDRWLQSRIMPRPCHILKMACYVSILFKNWESLRLSIILSCSLFKEPTFRACLLAILLLFKLLRWQSCIYDFLVYTLSILEAKLFVISRNKPDTYS